MGWSVAREIGLTHHRTHYSIKGYTLVTPLSGDSTYLLNMQGCVVHRWQYETIAPQFAKLLPNGNLAVLGTDKSLLPPGPNESGTGNAMPPLDRHVRRLGGNASTLLEMDWDGNIEKIKDRRITTKELTNNGIKKFNK